MVLPRQKRPSVTSIECTVSFVKQQQLERDYGEHRELSVR
jgi:hypothetical protein